MNVLLQGLGAFPNPFEFDEEGAAPRKEEYTIREAAPPLHVELQVDDAEALRVLAYALLDVTL